MSDLTIYEALKKCGFVKERTDKFTGKPFSMRYEGEFSRRVHKMPPTDREYITDVGVFLSGLPERQPHWVVHVGGRTSDWSFEKHEGTYDKIEQYLPTEVKEQMVFFMDIL